MSYTLEEAGEDIQLKTRFIDGVTFHYTDEDAYEILYSNCEKLVYKQGEVD